jgi:hypothetical protein
MASHERSHLSWGDDSADIHDRDDQPDASWGEDDPIILPGDDPMLSAPRPQPPDDGWGDEDP